MINKIKMLNDLTINKIAAGEVVEAPYSVIKELTENAIDANSTNITVEIKEGGQKLIRVSDNGDGIYEEDVEAAFMRHATSKIIDLEDLNTILTLGFRGEALASIASVSQIEITTKPRNQSYGIYLEIEGGVVINKKQVGCSNGTTITVKNLFFNTPARFKFMKSPQAEATKISELITRLALSQAKIGFKYINNNNIMFTTSGDGHLKEAILSILDKDLFKSLIPIHNQKEPIKLQGYIGQPTYARGNRNYEIVFVNGRYIKSKLVYKAIEDGYKEKLPINKFPVCIMNIEISPQLIDVNIHPMKTEIKFHNQQMVYDLIYNTIRNTLVENTTVPFFSLSNRDKKNHHNPVNMPFSPNLQENKSTYNTHNNNEFTNKTESNQLFFEGYREQIDNNIFINNDMSENVIINEDHIQTEVTQENFLSSLLYNHKVIGQLFNTYIIVEKDCSMILIDQHAAHERIVYNQMLQDFKNNKVVTQRLLTPKVLELSPEDFLLAMENVNKFNSLGFGIEVFGHNTIIIREVPLIMGTPRNFDFFIDILDDFKNEKNHESYFYEKIIRKSCREAIKAMDKLNLQEINALIKDLCKVQPPLTCPHGRPIVLALSKYEIEKNFKRVQ
ncbi:DNA mismatch repair endonuclease MutL [Natronincola ferrireducens]|uniref:DNA mismatch repair protein MutL n=1 Tax=Natronincola ferrireducens TaxID=393762 RepID=A0A1G9CBR2_9FIRM|nr:DNA mismatch repair endonuclease MutL [Natronincola ferrireducens]SDK49118.1 DNA mismatch repair protein MutL [Natronincola ferrireducens]